MTAEYVKETKGRGFLLSHTRGTEDNSYKRYPTKWTDDTRSDWTIESPLKEFDDWVPLFIRAGSIVPLRRYNASIEGGTNDTLILDIYPGADATFSLVEDDGSSNDYLNGQYAVTNIELRDDENQLKVNIEPVAGHFSQMKSWRKWALHIHTSRRPSKVLSNMDEMSYPYQQKKELLVIESLQPDKQEFRMG